MMTMLDLESHSAAPPPQVREVSTARPLRLIRPRGFRPAKGVQNGVFLPDGPQGFGNNNPRGRTPAQKRGKKYESQVLCALEAQPFELFTPSPWIEFQSARQASRVCQPDAIAFGPDWLLVIEVKLRHTIMAYWQLRELYEPVLRVMFPSYAIRVCEITRSFDPMTPWPEDILLLQDFNALRALRSQDFGVLQWRG